MGWASGLMAAGISAVSALDAKGKRLDAEAELESMQLPRYRKNQSIIDHYDNAMRKYMVSPTETAEFKQSKKDINQSTIQGLSAMRDRRVGDPSALIAGQNNSILKAASFAEQDKNRQAQVANSAYGEAAAEKDRDYNYNVLQPFQMKYNLLAKKAAALAAKQSKQEESLYRGFAGMAGG